MSSELFVRLFDFCLFDLSVSTSSRCLGRAAVCDCGAPWTFLLPFLLKKSKTDFLRYIGLLNFINDFIKNVLLLILVHVRYCFVQTSNFMPYCC